MWYFYIAVVDLATEGKFKEAAAFFEKEYQLDHLIGTLDTPYVAIMDGITSMCDEMIVGGKKSNLIMG